MNRRRFLSRTVLALGGVLLAPLLPRPAARWVKAFDPADIERAFAESVETWDFPTTTTAGSTAAWGNTIHFPRYENFTTRPPGGDFATDYWDGIAWRQVGD